MIAGQTVQTLADDLRALVKELPDGATDIANAASERLEQLGVWQEKLSAYGKVLDLAGLGMAEQIERVEAAQAAWPTEYVNDLLAKLQRINEPFSAAWKMRNADDWRIAWFFLQQARARAEEAGLAEQLSGAFQTVEEPLATGRRDYLSPLVAAADEWLTGAGPIPADPVDRLAKVDEAARARELLDGLDLDFPTMAQTAAGQEVFPWTVLSDDEKETVSGLLAWTTAVLSVQLADGAAAVADISLTFVPKPPGYEPFWMSQTEVTVGHYRAVMGELPPKYASGDGDEINDNDPVVRITRTDAQQFCTSLADSLDGRVVVRWPNSAEWQHALLAGRAGLLDASPQLCKYDTAGERQLDLTGVNLESAEYRDRWQLDLSAHEDGYDRYAPVGSYPPNRWLLYDMVGNVREWVSIEGKSGLASVGGSFRVPWDEAATEPNFDSGESTRYDDLGLRIVVWRSPGD